MAACTHCTADLPEGSKFCMACGTPVLVSVPACTGCGIPLPDAASFCPECGTAVPDRMPAAASSAPAMHPVAERRVTSILFGDLVGFTPLSESRDSEDVRELLSEYFQRCRVIVGRYGGVIEKFIGDAVMAVWGVPTAQEDAAERAVRAGLELVSMVNALGHEVGAPGLAQRVGIVTGEVAVTVGAIAEGMVAGDAVNTAARVQSAAAPGQVWVDDATRELASVAITFSDAGEHELKGKAAPMRLWAAGFVVAEVGGTRRVDGLEAPFVGRDADLRLIKELFHATQEAHRPKLVILDGEAGAGKSRLAWEFEKYIDGLSAMTWWHRGRCLSYGDGVAFWALAEAIRARFGLVEADTGAVVTELLDAGLAKYVPDAGERAWLRPRLAVLLGESGAGSFAREDLFAAWTAFLEQLATDDASVVLVVDDAQHADDGLLDFLDHLLATARASIFVLALARPELHDSRPSLGGRRASIVRLEPLDDDAMASLVDGLVADLPEAAKSALVDRAEGVPLFAVETVRALIDRDLVVPRDGRYVTADGTMLDLDSIGAPASLQALVAARLDVLDAAEKRVVSDASVLGLSFTRDGLLALGSAPQTLDGVLDGLRRREIFAVQTDRFTAELGQYRFVQSVVRQVAYATQSRRDRKVRHLAAADHLVGQSEGADDVAVVIAQHLLEALEALPAGDAEGAEIASRACHYLELAAARASEVGAPGDAVRLYATALDHITDPRAQARLHLEAAASAIDGGDFVAAAGYAAHASDAYDALGDSLDAGLAVAKRAAALSHLGDNAGAIAIATPRWNSLAGTPGAERVLLALAQSLARAASRRADRDDRDRHTRELLMLAEALGDPAALATAQIEMGIAYASAGAPATARVSYESAVKIARDHELSAVLARALATLSGMLNARDLPAALDHSRQAIEVARRAGLRERLDLATANYAIGSWIAGRPVDEMRAVLDEAMENASTADQIVCLLAIGEWVAVAAGDSLEPLDTAPDLAVTDEEQTLSWLDNGRVVRLMREGDVTSAAGMAQATLDRVLAYAGLEDDFLVLWPWLVEAAFAAGDSVLVDQLLSPVDSALPGRISPGVSGVAHRLRGLRAATWGDDPSLAETEMRAGIADLEAFGAVGHVARAQEELGRWLVDQDRPEEAQPHIDAARTTYTGMGATGWLARLDVWDESRKAMASQ